MQGNKLDNKTTLQSFSFDRNLTDLVKFLACLMIALHHYSQGMVVAGSRNPIYQLFSTQGGWLGVAIFFLLSGYGLMKSDLKHHLEPIPFFKKRLLKTYLPAVLVSLLWGGYMLIRGGQKMDFQFITGILWNFNDEVLWFVRAIVKLYVAFYVYSYLRVKMPRCKVLALVSIATLAVWWVSAGFIHGSSVILFFVGMTLAEFDEWWLKAIRKVYPVLITFIGIFALAFVYRHDAAWIHLLINYFLIFSCIAIVATFNNRGPKLPSWISGASYDVYLVHNKSLMLLRLNLTIVPFWMFVVLTIIFTIGCYNLRRLIKI